MDILLVHGYNVTSTRTYGVLPQRLKALGHTVKDVFLSKYVTLDDDIRLTDLVRAMQAALEDVYGAKFGQQEFAVITHSTGGLVVRAWIDTYYGAHMRQLPIVHLIMLAPPTNGSRLATLGKSMLSRLRNLWGAEPGLKILDALELGSEAQWDLNTAWMEKDLHTAPRFFPAVISGQWIDKKIWDVIIPAAYEAGSDGVVRAAAANPNMQKFTLRPDGKVERESMEGVPFLVTPKTSHSDTGYGIMGSIPPRGDHPVFDAIVQLLAVQDRKAYAAVTADWAAKTDALQRNDRYYDGSKLDRFCQVVLKISDDLGNRVTDYAIELLDGNERGDQLPGGFLAHQHKNDASPDRFVYYFNYDKISSVNGGKLGFRVQSVPNTPLIGYRDAKFVGAVATVSDFLRPNQTTLVNVVMKRRLNKNIFRLTKDFSIQKIRPEAGPEWIE